MRGLRGSCRPGRRQGGQGLSGLKAEGVGDWGLFRGLRCSGLEGLGWVWGREI